MTRRERTILIVVGTIGVLLLFYFYGYGPRQAEYQRLQAQLQTQQETLARMEATARQITRLREEFARLSAFIADIEAKLPAEKETPALLVQLERLTKSLAISMAAIRPGQPQVPQAGPGQPPAPGGARPQPQPGARPQAGAPAPAPGAVPTYLRFPISLTIQATYEALVRLTSALNDFPRMVAVRNLAISPGKLPELTVVVDLETYVLPKGSR